MLPCLYKKSPLFCSLCSVQLLPRPEMESVSPNTGYICRSAHYIPGKAAPACQKDTAFPVFLSRTSSSSYRYLSIPDAACQEYLCTQPLSPVTSSESFFTSTLPLTRISPFFTSLPSRTSGFPFRVMIF